jgi:tRNA pseudouridine55 synthase
MEQLQNRRSTINQQSTILNQHFALHMDGVLIIDKPAGPTSHDVVARMRRVLGTKRIGHTGTLDPFATGVLPLVIGRATRLASFLSGDEKTYEGGVRLGVVTDTYDGTRLSGEAIAPPSGIDRTTIEAALARFRGTFDQMPPPYSAKKIEGVPAYRLARKNRVVELRPVPVTVRELTLEGYVDGLASIRVRATAGFYVRSLAHDLGNVLGCGAHLETLRRTRAGAFGLDVSVPLHEAEAEPERARSAVVPLDRLLPEIAAVTLNERGVWRATHGNEIGAEDLVGAVSGADGSCRLLDGAGRLLGIAEVRPGGALHPMLVLV